MATNLNPLSEASVQGGLLDWTHEEPYQWQDYAIASNGLARLEELYNFPKTHRPPGMLITGPTNNGKTSLVNRFAAIKNGNRREGPERNERPVVYVQTPPTANVGQLFVELVSAVGGTPLKTGNTDRKINQTVTVLRNAGTRMLIIDEISNILSGNVKQIGIYLNSLKYLSNELRIPIVVIGVEEARIAMQTDQQVGNRFTPFFMPAWNLNREYGIFVGEIFKSFGIKARDIVSKLSSLSVLHSRTGGLTGETWNFAYLVAKTGHGLKDDTLTAESLDLPGWRSPEQRRW